MLRLKLALDDCDIRQQAIAAHTGWSKAAISIALNSGRLPADADKFRADVTRFIANQPKLIDWLAARGWAPAAMLLPVKAGETASNENGEIPGIGPEWRCIAHGQPGHDYQDCHTCHRRFDAYMKRLHGRAAVMGGAA